MVLGFTDFFGAGTFNGSKYGNGDPETPTAWEIYCDPYETKIVVGLIPENVINL